MRPARRTGATMSERNKKKKFDLTALLAEIKVMEPLAYVKIDEPRGECTSREMIVRLPGLENDALIIYGVSQEEVSDDDVVDQIVLRTWDSDENGGIYETSHVALAVLGARIACALWNDGWYVIPTDEGYW